MKKVLLLSFVIFPLLQGCYTGVVPLKGKYQSGPVTAEINAPFDDVWQSVSEYIAQSSSQVKTIDKQSGFVVFDVRSFKGKMSQEDEKGNLISPSAQIAVDRPKGDFPGPTIKYGAKGTWGLSIKKISESTSAVTVSVNSLSVGSPSLRLSGISTGNLENEVLGFIKNHSEK